MKYSLGPYNKFNDEEQWIRLTEGCPNNCSFCYEPREIKIFEISEIIRNDVKIMDMNLLCKKEALEIINKLGNKKVNNKVVYYHLVCGVDYRFLTQELADALKKARFKKIRLAWDYELEDQYEIVDAIKMLKKAEYKRPNDIMVFMICNWETPYESNLRKLEICKVWRVQVADCYYDNQTMPNVEPIRWAIEQIKDFRRKCRRHNQLVNFGLDIGIKKKKRIVNVGFG